MKKTLITILTSLILITTIFFMVGCSDMMAKLGNISLTIDLDTPEVEVSSYALEGTLTDSNSRFTLNNIVPPRHTLSELKEGRWNLTVKAFDDQGNQIGVGTKTVDLKAGQVVETSLLVEFGQSTPVLSTFTIAGPSRHDDREGSVAGTTTRMEYRLASAAADDPFTACTAGTTQLVPGEYHIRLAQAHGLQASESLTVTIPTYQKIQLTIAAPTLTTTKEYDGTDTVQGSITPGEPSGVRSGDDVAVHAQASYDSASVGNSKNITVVYSLSGADALNYTKPADTIVATGVINQKQLSISGTTVTTSKVYDGSTSATVTNHGTPDGKVGTEAVTVTATASYQDKHAGTGKLISVSYTLGGTHADNYLAPANTSFSGTITKSSLTVTYTTTPQPTKVYDGTATAQIATTGSLVGVVTGDRVELLTTATYDDHDADSSKSGTISYALSGTDANNYTAPANGTFSSGTITARPLTVTGYNLTASKPYDGNTNASIGSVTFNGKIPADEVQVSATAAYDSAAVSSEDLDKTITITYRVSGLDAVNYLEPVSSTALGTIVQKQLTVSETDIASTKVYDGSTLATVESHGTLDGKVDGEVVTVTAHPVYQDRHAGTGKLINVSYTLGGTNAGNYRAPANANFVGEITPKALEVSGTSVQLSKVYDGSTTAVVTASGSPSNLVSGDAVTVHAQASYDSADANEGKTLTVAYSISGANAKNYTAPAPSTYGSTGTITKRQLTATGYSLTASKPYDGNTDASIGSVAFNGKIAADEVQVIATATYDSAAVSSEDLDKTITITYRVSGLDAVNYLEPVSSTALGTIVQKQLTVSETDIASTKVYDGSTLATVESHGTLDGKVDGEVVTVTAHPVYQDRHAGTGKLINVSYTLGGTNAGNYRAPANANFVGEITPKALGVSGTSVQLSKVYDGSTTAVVTASGSPSNLVSGDAVTVHAQASYDTADANEGKTLTVTYSISGANAKNYTAPAPSTYGSTGTITKRQLTATGYNLTASKPYDGNANASIDSVTFSGNIFGDDIQVASTAAYDSAALGTNKPITVSYSLSGDDSPNYLKPADSIATVAGEIAKKQLTVSGTTVASKDYDGTTSAPIDSHGTLEGVVAGDTVTLSAVATYATKTARSGKEASVVYTLSGADKDKYLAPENGSLTGTINKRLLTATSIAVTGSKEYDGTRNASITACTINNLVAGDTVTVQKTATYDTKLAGTDKTITVSFGLDGTDKDNYIEPDSRVVYSNGIITQKSLTVSGTSYSTTKEYDGTTTIPITSNGTLQGVAVGDVVTLSNVTGFYTSADIGTNKAFTIRYTISGTDAANYTVPDTTGTSGTITKIAMTGDVTITGSAVFGQVLTAVPDLYNTGTPTYQWKRDDAAIIGATNTAYTLVEADIGKKISVTATATGTNYTGSITSEETATVTKAAGSALSDTFEAYYPIVSADQTNITQDIINLTGFTANQTGIEVSISTDGTSYESYSDLVIDSRGRAMISITSAQKVKLRYKATSTHYAGADLLLSVGAKDLAIGDYYAGGVVGYIYQTTDTAVYIANQVHGLIAAKADTSEGIKWSSNITLEIGTAVGIGTGWTNTQAIIDALDGSEVGRYAAKEADSMRDGGYDDWFLPSLNELKKLRDSRVLIGNFSTTWLSRYMSSSESTQKITQYPPKENYHIVYFDRNDDIIEVWTKDAGTHIRAVRYF